jgi:predicted RecB family nuclease
MDSVAEKSRVGKQYTHVSSLIGLCPRRHLLAFTSGVERSSVPKPSMRLVWALGRAAEHHARTQFLAALGNAGVLGTWTCKCGHAKKEGEYSEVPKCPKCLKKLDRYTEAGLFDHDNRIVGSPDLLYVRPDNSKVRVVEIKSMNKKDFEALDKPKEDHVHQAMGYNELLRINGYNVDDSITVLYVCKDFQWSKPYKEFSVERTDHYDSILNSMWSRALMVADGIRAKDAGEDVQFPARLQPCSSPTSSVAKSCDMCSLCFSI